MLIEVSSRSGTPDPAVRQEIEAADQALRQNFSGFDPDVIVPEIERAFAHLQAQPSADDIAGYARAISARADFELVLD
ncbi:hypothetical protein [Aeromicrobium wangtongii]|uniref:Uncharacterized protein n=1 Tax=Aeromicrobium wangtongii TaxID=2969247 RepID=A0ABY5MAV4_9ACTN|nr:hypothetical protein [Aeromicrobium wangtongii]MCD9199775.1 hypothetical protein [Aeromicrobium wangtongii]MCL3817527.1 hypothetical protein [Aeromicrobium wangtongii]UUP14125.1 hypothetical protein NQV15_02095 [Aeromicrobium wangtongii]